MRDSQRSRVYEAEAALAGDADLMTIAECRRFVNSIICSRWWKARCNLWSVRVFDGRGTRRARGGHFQSSANKAGWGISLPKWARTRATILHELSHVITEHEAWFSGVEEWQWPKLPAHGRAFCRNFLALVGRWMGKDEAARLRDSFRDNGAKWVRIRK